jgi:hypothetical protein
MGPTMNAYLIRNTVCAFALSIVMLAPAHAVEPRIFPTPEAAVEALGVAAKASDDAPLVTLFGDAHLAELVQQDRAMALADRAQFATAFAEYHMLRDDAPNRRTVLVGYDAWPFPIPLVTVDGGWRFAPEQGVQEILNRRIGRDELNAIDVLRAYVDAQRAYAAKDRLGDGVFQYAKRIGSSAGKRDGLYWPADTAKGDEESPFGPLLAEATPYLTGHKAGDPYRGYYFKILTAQGSHAAGGPFNYIIHGRMIAGFGMVAYPTQYGKTGVMSFIVNQNGRVFEKNLGANSAATGASMKIFDPGPGWSEVPAD